MALQILRAKTRNIKIKILCDAQFQKVSEKLPYRFFVLNSLQFLLQVSSAYFSFYHFLGDWLKNINGEEVNNETINSVLSKITPPCDVSIV